MMERSLEQIAESIRIQYAAGVVGMQAAFEAKLAIGRDLYEARRRLSSNNVFGEWVRSQDFGFTRQWAWVLVEAAKNERAVRALTTQVVNAGGDINIKAAVSSVRNGVHYSSDSAEWYTPPDIVQRVVKVLGKIDLDPCADEKRSIPAAQYFVEEDDGLNRDWAGRVYMNPPYGGAIGGWVLKLTASYAGGDVPEAIALVPARVDTEWFASFRDAAICFVRGRLKFSGNENSAPFPSAVVYLGKRVARFDAAFREIGDTWTRWHKD